MLGKIFLLSGLMLGSSFFVASPDVFAKDAIEYKNLYMRPSTVPHPKDNAFTEDRARLGQALFFDPRLSGSNWISCATCHNPSLSYGDGLATGIGDGMHILPRKTPTVLNSAWGELYFWDGRAESLEEQALMPVAAAEEMNAPIEKVVEKISKIPDYRKMFDKAYPNEGINAKTLSKALALYQRTLVSGEAPFDRYIKGDDKAISASAIRGFVLFNEKAACAKCHSGWRFSDEGFYDVGMKGSDSGRGKVIPEVESLTHAFKTPMLRNVAQRSPYMHDGSEPDLQAVVDFYNRGGDVKRPSVSEHIKPLGLTDSEKGAIIDFLKTLTSQDKGPTLFMLPQ